MKKKQLAAHLLPLCLIGVIVGIIIYTYRAVQVSQFPFKNEQLAGYTYLALATTDCTTCSLVHYFWKDTTATDCILRQVTTSETLQTREASRNKMSILSVEDIPLERWLAEKGDKKYIFDVQSYTSFATRCGEVN